jgi:DnaJ-class molecular chaperone
MANYEGKPATEKCDRCSGKGYNIRFREEGIVLMKCHRCEGTGATVSRTPLDTIVLPSFSERGSLTLRQAREIADNVIEGFRKPDCPDCRPHGRPGWIELATSWVKCECNSE